MHSVALFSIFSYTVATLFSIYRYSVAISSSTQVCNGHIVTIDTPGNLNLSTQVNNGYVSSYK
jgi:hypothetical protein